MDFLRELGISDDIIHRMEMANDRALTFNFICSKDNVVKNIEYLRDIGVEVIELLLIYRIEFFLIEHNKLKNKFDSFEVSALVQLINEDINAVNLL